MSEVFNVSANPHVRSKDTTQTIMRDVLIALTPASIFGIYNFGLGALIRIIVGIAACVASEALYEYFMHKKITVSPRSRLRYCMASARWHASIFGEASRSAIVRETFRMRS